MGAEEERLCHLLFFNVAFEMLKKLGRFRRLVAGPHHQFESVLVCLRLQFPRVTGDRRHRANSPQKAGQTPYDAERERDDLKPCEHGGFVLDASHVLNSVPVQGVRHLVTEQRGELSLVLHFGQ